MHYIELSPALEREIPVHTQKNQKRTLPFLASFILTLSLMACGSKPGTSEAYQAGSENCSSEFVSDYNKVSGVGKYNFTLDELERFEFLVDEFSKKYKDVTCKAEVTYKNSIEKKAETVNANDEVTQWREIISKAKARRQPAPASNSSKPAFSYPGTPAAYDGSTQNCSSIFIDDYKNMLNHAKNALSRLDYDYAKTIIAEFKIQYESVECYAKSDSDLVLIHVNKQCDLFLEKIRTLSAKNSYN